MIKSATQCSVRTIFNEDTASSKSQQYQIPPYQREYAWGKEQWENLFDDIIESDGGCFLGSVICIQENSNTDVIINQVVDGQQRLTTLSLLFIAIQKYIPELKRVLALSDYNNRDKTKKDTTFNEIDGFITLDIDGEPYKLQPSMQNSNKIDYQYLVDKEVLEEDVNYPNGCKRRKIYKAYQYFYKRIGEFLNENLANDDYDNSKYNISHVEKLLDLIKKVSSSCLVVILVADVSSAFTLFESLNNRGMPLTPMDLIKNQFIKIKTENDSNINAEKVNEKWQVIIDNIPDYDNQVRFLRHYYLAFRNPENIEVDGYKSITKSKLISLYSDMMKDDAKFNIIYTGLIKKSELYAKLVYPENIELGGSYEDDMIYPYQKKLIDLKNLGIAPAYSLLLYIFSYHEKESFTELLSYLENWFICRHITNTPPTSKLDKIFTDLIDYYYEEKSYSFDKIKSYLDGFLDTEYVKSRLINDEIYKDNKQVAKCLLIKMEGVYRKDNKQRKTDFWEVRNKKPIWTIEHIYPQNPDKNSDWYEQDLQVLDEQLHKLGNLTLTCYNSNLSNRSFSEKANYQTKEGDVGLKSGHLEINQYLLDKEQWTSDNIDNRGRQLAEDFIKLFD